MRFEIYSVKEYFHIFDTQKHMASEELVYSMSHMEVPMLLWFIFQGFSLYAKQQVRYCAQHHHRNKVMDFVHRRGDNFHVWVHYSFNFIPEKYL